MTLERDIAPRSYAWVPTKNNAHTQENINYKTFNNVAERKKKANPNAFC